MSTPAKPTQYQALLQKCQPQQQARKSGEQQLDALLQAQQRRSGAAEDGPAQEALSPLDQLRRQMREQLLPVFNELRGKYEPSGILMAIDADDFLAGGVQLAIEVRYDIHGMRLEGTATPSGIAFHETRFSDNIPGVVTTGPMLSARNLSGQTFREFICDRIGQLVRSALRRREGAGA
jgi:hypothetical protein